MRSILRPLTLVFLLASCGQSENSNSETKNIPSVHDEEVLAQGFVLLQNSCFSCHNPDASHESSVAPSMKEIKVHYQSPKIDFQNFLDDFKRFIKEPSAENSKISGAIQKYGMMPKFALTETEIQQIAAYIYQTPFDDPNWYSTNFEKEREKYMNSNTSKISPLELGKQIAMQTKGVLGSNLKQALNTKGTEEALAFCSTRAIALTDSMAIQLKAKVRRVSDQNRNPQNQANADELAYIQEAKKSLQNQAEIKPKVVKTASGHTAYYPILTDQMCLQCHGKPKKDITPAVLAKINSLYPKDKAMGYKVNELRGIWVVEMN